MTKILDPRETYIFPEYVNVPYKGDYEQLCKGIESVLEQEFNACIEYAEVTEVDEEPLAIAVPAVSKFSSKLSSLSPASQTLRVTPRTIIKNTLALL